MPLLHVSESFGAPLLARLHALFNAMRAELEAEFGIQVAWWGQQPACTSKSGWITLGAHPKADKRVSFQIAACRLGFAIMQALPCDDHRYH